MKKRAFGFGLILIFILGVVPLQVYAATAKETVEGQINKILDKMREPGFKGQPKDVKIAQIRQIITEVFDYAELSKRALGRAWKKFSAVQRKEFINLFSALLENVYADRILAYTHEKINFGREIKLKKGRVEVQSHIITADNKKVPLFYRMILKQGHWRVYDVVIEGVSMVKNYRGQFKQILAKKSADDLFETLRQKIAKEKPAG